MAPEQDPAAPAALLFGDVTLEYPAGAPPVGGLSLRLDPDGITIGSLAPGAERTIPWSRIGQPRCGLPGSLADGRPGVELAGAVDGRPFRFFVPADQLPPARADALTRVLTGLAGQAPADPEPPPPAAPAPSPGFPPVGQPPPTPPSWGTPVPSGLAPPGVPSPMPIPGPAPAGAPYDAGPPWANPPYGGYPGPPPYGSPPPYGGPPPYGSPWSGSYDPWGPPPARRRSRRTTTVVTVVIALVVMAAVAVPLTFSGGNGGGGGPGGGQPNAGGDQQAARQIDLSRSDLPQGWRVDSSNGGPLAGLLGNASVSPPTSQQQGDLAQVSAQFEQCMGIPAAQDRIFGDANGFPTAMAASPAFAAPGAVASEAGSTVQIYKTAAQVSASDAQIGASAFPACFGTALGQLFVDGSSQGGVAVGKPQVTETSEPRRAGETVVGLTMALPVTAASRTVDLYYGVVLIGGGRAEVTLYTFSTPGGFPAMVNTSLVRTLEARVAARHS